MPACGSCRSGTGRSGSAGSISASTVLRFGWMPTGCSSCHFSLDTRWQRCWRIRSWRSRAERGPWNTRPSPSPTSIAWDSPMPTRWRRTSWSISTAGVARWFDFETIHEANRPLAWRRADDLRALLVTCLVRTAPEKRVETLEFILDVYADEDVTRVLATSFTSVWRRSLTLHLLQGEHCRFSVSVRSAGAARALTGIGTPRCSQRQVSKGIATTQHVPNVRCKASSSDWLSIALRQLR